ncbi:MAG: outer membrane beta-barrel protein [Candidatus Aminicenantes bacterium]|nr:MAG: outer membrane beta-barrel protein [Candidatus Aminicenantes bacterium]
MKKLVLMMILTATMMIGVNHSALSAQSINFKIGVFHPAMDSDLWETNMDNLAFTKQDMRDAYYGIEYEHFLNRFISFALEGGVYDNEHFSFYRDYEYEDGSPIYQNLALRIISAEADFKLYPLGHRQRFCPFLGGGAGMYFWKYEQWGDFINFESGTVDEDEYAETSTYTVGFNAKAGFVARFSRNWGVLLEARYQHVKGELSSFFEGWEKLDLSGFTFSIGINFFLR